MIATIEGSLSLSCSVLLLASCLQHPGNSISFAVSESVDLSDQNISLPKVLHIFLIGPVLRNAQTSTKKRGDAPYVI